MTTGRDLQVTAPERWDEACCAVPAARALVATGLSLGVLCRDEPHALWHRATGVRVTNGRRSCAASVASASWTPGGCGRRWLPTFKPYEP